MRSTNATASKFLSKTSIAIALAGMAFATVAGAADTDSTPSIFSVSGFGTVGFSYSGDKEADFVSSVFHPNGAGYTRSLSTDVDTKFGLQVSAKVTDDLTGVLQLISKQRHDGSYKPTVEWANLSYQITPDLNVRIGRVVWPLFSRSDTENVGFTNYFIRNSAELAAEMPNTFSDGVDASYRFKLGGATNTVQLLFGNSKVKYPGDGLALDVTDIKGVSNVLEYGAATVHAAYMKMDYLFVFPGGPPDKVALTMKSLGATYDPGTWFVTGDILRAPDPFYGLMSAFSVGGGYRIDQFTPYINYSQFKQVSVGSIGGSVPKDKQSTASLGIRYDFMKNADLKLQYDRIKSGDVARIFPISLTNIQPGFDNRPKASVVSLVADFIF